MSDKLILTGIDDFRAREGELLFISSPVRASKDRIQEFCHSVNQMDWFHWDEERAAASDFGAIVAPGMFTLSLIHSTYFDNVELHGLKALFLGSDRFRILKPVAAGCELTLTFTIARVEQREQGFAVHYDYEWHVVGEEPPVTLGNFIVRYWPA